MNVCSIPDNRHESSSDSNPYAYPYFHTNHSETATVYDFVVRLGALWIDSTSNSTEEQQEQDNDDDNNDNNLLGLAQKIQARAMQFPDEVLWKDSCGDTALHRLAQAARFPDTDDVDILMNAKCFPLVAQFLVDAVVSSDNDNKSAITQAQNNWNETPLHQFVQHCGFPSVMTGESNHDDEFQRILSLVKNPLIDFYHVVVHHGAATLKSCWDSLPLHDACQLQGAAGQEHFEGNNKRDHVFYKWLHEQNFQIVKLLYQAHPQALLARDSTDLTPLHRSIQATSCSESKPFGWLLTQFSIQQQEQEQVWEPFLASLASVLLNEFGNDNQSSKVLMKLEQGADPQEVLVSLQPLWDKLVHFLRVNKRAGAGDFMLVHEMARLLSSTTVNLVQGLISLASALHPEQVSERDENGQTPLLILLVSQAAPRNLTFAAEMEAVLNQESVGMCDTTSGRFPLHWALDEYYATTIGRRQRAPPCFKQGKSVNAALGLEIWRKVWEAEPRILTCRDPVTNLYPFMLAARDNDDGSTSRQDVSAIYELLRADPSLLTG